MTALEMWDKLNFEVDWSLEETGNELLILKNKNQYEDDVCIVTEYVKFDNTIKEYRYFEENFYFNHDIDIERYSLYASVELHKAITQQMKELGWLE